EKFVSSQNIKNDNYNCKISKFIRTEKDIGNGYDNVFWEVNCENKNNNERAYYMVNKYSFIEFFEIY
ncbi:MAG: hypothetical protein ABJ349_19380, partial [Hyphomicrobiales bacterium]